MMDNQLPMARSGSTREREIILRTIADRGLCGLANDTKWNEFITAIRERENWKPSYRFKCVDGPPSDWDVEWFYHLPFPLVSVEWLDLCYLQEVRIHRLPMQVEVINHSGWIEELLHRVGLDYRKGTAMIRIFGYSPRNLDFFEV